MGHTLEETENWKYSNCLISGNPTYKILDFGMHAFADSFISKDELHKSEPIALLQCYLNSASGLVQAGCIANAHIRYNLYDYSYTSSNSEFSRQHWNDFHKTVSGVVYLDENSNVVEIGSNDGYLLKLFKDHNKCKVVGVDASKTMCAIAEKIGVPSFQEIFSFENSHKYAKADLVIANNVLNHSNDPVNFVKGVHNILSDKGIFVFEVPYWKKTIESGHFDQIYHEHVSYFTAKSLKNLLEKANMKIMAIKEIDYHGGSLRVWAKKVLFDYNDSPHSETSKLIEEEIKAGLFISSTYFGWEADLKSKRSAFLSEIHWTKLEYPSSKIIGIGAAAKANTFLTYYGLNNTMIDYITDSSPHKKGKFTPLTRIPIVDDNIFKELIGWKKVYALVLSWNNTALKQKILDINPNVLFFNEGKS